MQLECDGQGRYSPMIELGSTRPPNHTNFGPNDKMGEGSIFDAQSYITIELDELYKLLNGCRTELGRTALQRAIAHPPTTIEDIRARQEGLAEFAADNELQAAAEELIIGAAREERGLFELGWARFGGLSGGNDRDPLSCGGYGYTQFRQTRRLLRALEEFGRKTTGLKSPYLTGLMDDFGELEGSRAFKLVDGPAYVTDNKPAVKGEKPWYKPGYRFRPTLFKPLLLLLIFLLPQAINYFYQTFFTTGLPDFGFANISALGILMLYAIVPFFFVYVAMVGSHERDNFMKPTGQQLRNDARILKALDALGELEVLRAHAKFAEHYPGATCLPEILDETHHNFMANGLRNPVIGMEEPDYIPNDIAFDKARLSFITGPNSGGKTALSKSVCQNQVLAQMGGFVTAGEARLTPAAQIAYQVPQPGELNRREGRFATELSRTRDIFFAATPRALVVLDEPFEGTSFEERLETSEQVLDGFIRLEASVLFITHNHALAVLYRDKDTSGTIQFLEANFENDRPMHKFREGIASTSHAARIANEIGFGQEDIERRFAKDEN